MLAASDQPLSGRFERAGMLGAGDETWTVASQGKEPRASRAASSRVSATPAAQACSNALVPIETLISSSQPLNNRSDAGRRLIPIATRMFLPARKSRAERSNSPARRATSASPITEPTTLQWSFSTSAIVRARVCSIRADSISPAARWQILSASRANDAQVCRPLYRIEASAHSNPWFGGQWRKC